MKKAFRKIHLWLSVPFGVIIALICFSGAMLVFENEIMQMTHRHLYYVGKIGKKPIPMEQLAAKVSATLPDDVKVTGITVFPDPQKAYQINLSKPKRTSIYIDPYTGEIKGRNQRSPFFKAMFSLHRWLLDSRPEDGKVFWGKTIVGISTLIFIFVLVSGIIIWWPRTRKALKNSLKINLRKGASRFWHDLHVAGGIYALVLLSVMALTGLTWSFDWYRTAFYTAFGVEMTANTKHNNTVANASNRTIRGERNGNRDKSTGNHREELSFSHWQQVYEQLAQANPNNKQISIADGTASVSSNRFGNTRGADRYTFDTNTGKITGVSLYEESDKSGKIRGWIYSVHVGDWGGTLTRILWFLSALLGASLPLTGYYLWIKRLYRKGHTKR